MAYNKLRVAGRLIHREDVSDPLLPISGLFYKRQITMPDSDKQMQEKRERAWELHAQGVPVEDIASELDWSRDTVKAVLQLNHYQSSSSNIAHRESLQQRADILRAEGLSYTKIANRFNEEGVPTLSGRGRWHHAVIRRLLRE